MENPAPNPQQQTQDFTPVLPTPPSEPSPPKKRRAKKIFFTSLILLFIAIGIGIGTMKTAGIFPAPAPTPTTSPTSDEKLSPTLSPDLSPASTETMKTYRNTDNKFSLSHPGSLAPKETKYDLGVVNISFNDSSGESVYQMLIFSKALAGMIGQNFDTYYDMAPNTKTAIKDADGNSQEFTKVRNSTIGAQRAFDYRTTSSPPNPDQEADSGTYIEIGGNILIISTGESNREQLDAMLSSFKYPTN